MGNLDDSEIAHCGREPLGVPRRTESADKSDALQTLRAPAESADHGSAFGVPASSAPLSKAGCDSIAGSVHGKPPFVFRIHWDHEPTRPRTRPRPRRQFTQSRTRTRTTTRTKRRFMERVEVCAAMN